jgi:hypothetical protein
MEKSRLKKAIQDLLRKPEAILFKDESGIYFAGSLLTESEYTALQRSHAVRVITWIEETQLARP